MGGCEEIQPHLRIPSPSHLNHECHEYNNEYNNNNESSSSISSSSYNTYYGKTVLEAEERRQQFVLTYHS